MSVPQEKPCSRCGSRMKLEKEQSMLMHEIWGSVSHPWNPTNLPDPYHYTHKKSTLRIFRNAARNLVTSGGGDAVASINTMWVELRQIMDRLGLPDWPSFEKFVTITTKSAETEGVPEAPEAFVDLTTWGAMADLTAWIKRALVWSATDYGTETRETAKFMLYYWRELLGDPEIKHGLDNPPKPDEKTETEIYVRKVYFQVLGRHPDRGGLDNYVKEIQEGRLTKERLPAVLMQSPEYRQKFGKKEETMKVQLPIDVNITLSEEVLAKLLVQSRTFNEVFKPRLDVGRFIELNVSKDFWDVFYEQSQAPDFAFGKFVKLLEDYHAEKMITAR